MSKKDFDYYDDFFNPLAVSIEAKFEVRRRMLLARSYNDFFVPCVGGLISRQCTLLLELLRSPSLWNRHVAPLIIRPMVELRINLSWILVDPDIRCEMFVEYGLGQTKLFVEKAKKRFDQLEEGEEKDSFLQTVKGMEESIEREINTFFLTVNLGSWAKKNLRQMSKEAGLQSVYESDYIPLSPVVHNTWQHIRDFNVTPCSNSMHKFHYVPIISQLESLPFNIELAARAFDETLAAIDKFLECDLSERPILEQIYEIGVDKNSA